jgi:hypothetical protein
MFTTHVEDPRGKEWLVDLQLIPSRQGIGLRERFIHRHSRKQKPNKQSGRSDFFDFLTLPIPDSLDDLWILLAIIAAVLVVFLIGWPVLLLLSDFIWLVLVVLGGILSFVILRRPITVTAKSGEEGYFWKVRGLRQARKHQQEVVLAISQGEHLVDQTPTPSSLVSK